MALNNYSDRVSFEKWLINLNEELEIPLSLLTSTLKQLNAEETDVNRKEQLQIALDLSQRFGGLMHNLNLAALEQTQMALLRISKINLNRFLNEVVSSFELSLVNSGSNIHLHINNGLKDVYVDYDRLNKIVATLISNAIQFSKGNGSRIDVTLDTPDEKTYQIRVQDDGVGIVPEKLAHVFDPLYDDDPVHLKLYQSTSAGLYLILLYARAMGGNIKVESEKMVFTRFTVTLPLITKAEDIQYTNFELVNTAEGQKDTYERRLALTHDFRTQRQNTFETTTVLALGDQNVLKGFEAFFNNEVRLMWGTDSAMTIARALHLRPNLIILHDGDYGDIAVRQVAQTLKGHDLSKSIPLVWISDNEKIEEADLNISAGLPTHDIFEKIADLMNLRQKLIQELMADKSSQVVRPRYQNNKEAFLTRLERVVDAHMARNDLDMEKLSEMLFLNRSQIHRKVKAYTGMNTTEYIRNYKLKIAWRDLEQQSGTIAEIAYRCGFNSPSYFSKSFRESFGISPSEVLSGHQKNHV